MENIIGILISLLMWVLIYLYTIKRVEFATSVNSYWIQKIIDYRCNCFERNIEPLVEYNDLMPFEKIIFNLFSFDRNMALDDDKIKELNRKFEPIKIPIVEYSEMQYDEMLDEYENMNDDFDRME